MSPRVLVVEDDAGCREATARGLSALGWDVRTTADFDEALRLAFGWAPQVVLIDWGLSLRAPGALDLGCYLSINSARLPVPRSTAIEIYRARFRGSAWAARHSSTLCRSIGAAACSRGLECDDASSLTSGERVRPSSSC